MPGKTANKEGKEILQRISTGITVSLFWHGKKANPIFTITASLAGERKVHDATWTMGTNSVEEALDMFHHPFSYALSNKGVISHEIKPEAIAPIEIPEEEPEEDEGGVMVEEEDGR